MQSGFDKEDLLGRLARGFVQIGHAPPAAAAAQALAELNGREILAE